MKIEYRYVNELSLYNDKLRVNTDLIDVLFDSIKEFGFINPIIINKNNLILSGQSRLQVAKMLDMKKVPCIVVEHLTEEQEKIYRLVENKTSEFAIWDYDELDKELCTINRNLFKYDLMKDDNANVNINDFFVGEFDKQMTIFDVGGE